MPEAAFIVEGELEQNFIHAVCPGKRAVLLGCNGDEVAPSAVAKHIFAKFLILGNRHFPIVIWLDLENRRLSQPCFIIDLQQCLEDLGLDKDQFVFAVPDRCTECWILADPELIRETYGFHSQECFEGVKAKATLASIVARQEPYTHRVGTRLLTAARASVIAVNSVSAQQAFVNLSEHFDDCWWLKR